MLDLRRLVPALGLLLAGCAAFSGADVPARLTDVPWPDSEVDEGVEGARQLADLGQVRAALTSAEFLVTANPRHVDAQRLRQDLLRSRGRLGRVLWEADQRIAEWDDAAEAHYLRGRVVLDWDEKRTEFEAALARKRDLFWGWLGLAFVARRDDLAEALSIYDAIYHATDGVPVAAIAYGETLRVTQHHAEALDVYRKLRGAGEREAGIASLGLAETYASADRRREAWPPLVDALHRRPWDPGVRRLLEAFLAQGLGDAQVEQIVMQLWEDPRTLRDFVSGGGASLAAALFQRAGLDPQAREVLRDPAAPHTAAAQRQLRRLALAGGDVTGYLRSLRDELPARFLDDEANQVRGLWIAVIRGPWMNATDPLADPDHALGLAAALRDVGLLYESQLVATLAIERHPGAVGIVAVRDEVQRELAFESALRRVLYSGYGGTGKFDLDQFLAHARELSKRILGRDVVGQPKFFQVPLVGRLVDPFGPGLPEYLAHFNKHLVLGQRSNLPPEGLVLTRLSLRFLEPSTDLPVPARCWQVVGEDRQVQSLQGVLGGDLAGVALLNHYVVDMDAVRDWAADLARRRRIVHEDDDALLSDPLPEGGDDLDPIDAQWRLTCVSPVEDSALDDAIFDTICLHERAHLVDSFHYLPPERNLWRVLGLLLSNWFSSFAIEAEMEGRAEAAALAFGDHPRLVLAHIASFVGTGIDGSTHGEGFTRLARALIAKMAADPELAPFAAVRRWYQAPPDAVQRIAKEIAASYWP